MEHLSKDSLNRLLETAKQHSERDWLMILLGYAHGLRVSEILGLTPENFQDGYLVVNRLKGSNRTKHKLRSHANPLLDEVAGLEKYLASVQPGSPLFSMTRQHFWRLMKRYGHVVDIPRHKAHPHVLKHSIAMHTIKDIGIEKLRKFLGHKSIASTGEYLKEDEEVANDAVASSIGGI